MYAAISAYWGAGGTALLGTLGGTLEHLARSPGPAALLMIWATVVLKLAAAALGLVASVRPRGLNPHRMRDLRNTAWLVAVVLVIYGGVLSLVGWLVQAGTIHASRHADVRALRWHAFLWDPWFLAWGLLLTAALALSRQPASAHAAREP